MLCKYTFIKYIPKLFAEEFINVAFIFHDVSTGKISCKQISKMSRVKNFADDIDVNYFSKTLNYLCKYIQENGKDNIFNVKKINSFSENYLESLNNMFLNEFQLGQIVAINSNDPERDFEDLYKLFLYYDLDKESRPSDDKIENTIKRITKDKLKDNANIRYEANANYKQTLGESVRFDFKIGDIYYKIINPISNSGAYKNKYDYAKAWAYNAEYVKNGEDKVCFIMTSNEYDDDTKIVFKILDSKGLKVISANTFMESLEKSAAQ